jgi:2,4-dienoyl-CoA reductase (NADPH2)
VIKGNCEVGKKVAIIGAGGIGFDVAELVSHKGESAALNVDIFAKEWGIDFKNHPRGGVTGIEPKVEAADREIFLMQRKSTRLGRSLGKTTGWTHRMLLNRRGVNMISGVEYKKIDDDGLHVTIDGESKILDVDTVIVCAGQNSLTTLHDELKEKGVNSTLVGGAFEAVELDAKTAIKQACELAAEV